MITRHTLLSSVGLMRLADLLEAGATHSPAASAVWAGPYRYPAAQSLRSLACVGLAIQKGKSGCFRLTEAGDNLVRLDLSVQLKISTTTKVMHRRLLQAHRGEKCGKRDRTWSGLRKRGWADATGLTPEGTGVAATVFELVAWPHALSLGHPAPAECSPTKDTPSKGGTP